MKKYILIILIPVLNFCSPSASSSEEESANYQLVWADEFENDGNPDSTKWTYEHGFVRNQENQWYQEENAFCENGFLVIEAREEQVKNPNYDANSSNWKQSREFANYTSSSLNTRGLHWWTYGRFEIRAKIDIQSGMWPAFWTLGVSGEWPGNGEIDIMEFYRGKILANVAWANTGRYQAIWDSETKAVNTFSDPKWADKFHVWRMDWTEDFIRLYVDNELLNETDLSKTINKRGDIENPFHHPHYILLNLAIGGMNGGDPSISNFPSRYEVDYVRVYQKR